jgi:hypothetical protein
MPNEMVEKERWFPSDRINYATGTAGAAVVALSEGGGSAGFLGGFLVSEFFVLALSIGIASMIARKKKDPRLHGWAFFYLCIGFSGLMFYIQHQ